MKCESIFETSKRESPVFTSYRLTIASSASWPSICDEAMRPSQAADHPEIAEVDLHAPKLHHGRIRWRPKVGHACVVVDQHRPRPGGGRRQREVQVIRTGRWVTGSSSRRHFWPPTALKVMA